MKIKLNRQVHCKNKLIPSAYKLKQWVAASLDKAHLAHDSVELSIRAVEAEESAALNEQYRGKKGPTNVLSFPDTPIPGIKSNYLGDLAICVELVEHEAQRQNITIENHWAHLVIHGTLHLLGYDHIQAKDAEVMEALEVDILKGFEIKDPYNE